MVAVINASSSLRNALHYNENKLKQNVAQLIHSSGFARDTEILGFSDKIKTLEKLARLNENARQIILKKGRGNQIKNQSNK